MKEKLKTCPNNEKPKRYICCKLQAAVWVLFKLEIELKSCI